MKKLLFTILSTSLISIMPYQAFAASIIPQKLVDINTYEDKENGNLSYEYIWEDNPTITFNASPRATEDEQLAYASWQKHSLSGGELKHRAAKISPDWYSSAWYACAQTDYPKWHFSRARIIETLTGKILEDSNQVQVSSGMATARTPKDKTYLRDWDFSLRSYWGT